MFFNKKKNEDNNDPKKALEKAGNVLNKGLMGGLTKAFMGKGFVDKMNMGLNMGNQMLKNLETNQTVAKNGAEAMAEVLSVKDTGQTVNMNPMLILGLKLKPADGPELQTMAQVLVPRISIPRVGDTIKVKYNPQNPAEIALV